MHKKNQADTEQKLMSGSSDSDRLKNVSPSPYQGLERYSRVFRPNG